MVDTDIERPSKIVPGIFDFFYRSERFLYLSPSTTWRPSWCLLCDVIWAPPECNAALEIPYDVIEQLRAGSQEFANWLKFSQ